MKKKLCLLLVTAIILTNCSNIPFSNKSNSPIVESSNTNRLTSGSGNEGYSSAADPTVLSITPAHQGDIADAAAEYKDAVGWLTVPGTSIDSIVVQNPLYDNSYYLSNDINGNPDKNGTYCSDYRCELSGGDRKSLSFNTVLFAHNHDDNPDGILFAQLKKFKDPEFAKEHPYVFFSANGEDMAWEIFAVFDTTVSLPYIYSYASWDYFQKLLDVVCKSSVYNYGIKIDESDKILTLSTCTFSVANHEDLPKDIPNDYRFVVMARLVEPNSQVKSQAEFTLNTHVMAPDDQPPEDEWEDILYFNDNEYYMQPNSWIEDNFSLSISHLKPSKLAKIKRSGIFEDHQNCDATILSAGTDIYGDSDYPGIIMIMQGDRWLFYNDMDDFSYEYSELILTDPSGSVVKAIHWDDSSPESYYSEFFPYIDMGFATPLEDDPEVLKSLVPNDKIVLFDKTDHLPFVSTVFVGTPPSLEKEVTIIFGSTGKYYMPAENFSQFADLILKHK